MNWLWALLPEEANLLVIPGIALVLILGFISRRAAFRLIVFFLLSLALAPFIESLIVWLPSWLLLILLTGLGLSILTGGMRLLLGKGAADEMIGSLAADLVKWVLKAVFFPLRMLWWILRK